MTPYQKKIQAKRTLAGVGAAFLLHILLALLFVLFEYFFVQELTEFSGPVMVKLGDARGEDIPVISETELQETEPPGEPEASDIPLAEEKKAAVPDAFPLAESESRSLPEPQPAPREIKAPEPPDSRKAQVPKDSQPAREPQPARESQPVREPQPVGEPQPQIIRGEEAGNSWEYQFMAEEGMIRRSFGDDISLHMPLPTVLDAQLVEGMKGESYLLGTSRQEIFQLCYKKLGNSYYLDTPVEEGNISSLWRYLDEAGYDLTKADYKRGGQLKTVVILFSISPEAELLELKIIQSSGFLEVDKAVERGFRSATFSNSGGRIIKGRFSYRFQ